MAKRNRKPPPTQAEIDRLQSEAIAQAEAARHKQAAALQGLTAALNAESWQRLARLYPLLAEGIQRAIAGGARPGAIGAVIAIRAGSEGLAAMGKQAASHFAATYTGPIQNDPDPMAGIVSALDAQAWGDLQDRYPDLANAIQAAIGQGLPPRVIRAHVARHSQNPDLARYIDQAATHLAAMAE